MLTCAIQRLVLVCVAMSGCSGAGCVSCGVLCVCREVSCAVLYCVGLGSR